MIRLDREKDYLIEIFKTGILWKRNAVSIHDRKSVSKLFLKLSVLLYTRDPRIVLILCKYKKGLETAEVSVPFSHFSKPLFPSLI